MKNSDAGRGEVENVEHLVRSKHFVFLFYWAGQYCIYKDQENVEDNATLAQAVQDFGRVMPNFKNNHRLKESEDANVDCKTTSVQLFHPSRLWESLALVVPLGVDDRDDDMDSRREKEGRFIGEDFFPVKLQHLLLVFLRLNLLRGRTNAH